MKISNYANNVEPSLARALFNKAKSFNDVIDLTLGDPDFSTPEHIKTAACKSIMKGYTHYSANAGLIEARQAIAGNIKKNWGIDADPTKEIIITVGGMEALFLTLTCLIDPGDEVIIFAPYYVNYMQMVRFLGGVPVVIDTYLDKKGVVIEESALRAAVSDKTVAIIVNSPSNPTGAVIDRDTLSMIAKVSDEHDIPVISDEVYRTLIFDGKQHESILHHIKNKKNAILIDSLSKEFCMTGWRIGHAYADSELIANMTKLQENVAACAPLPSQYALIEAYNAGKSNADVLKVFEERRNVLYEEICKIEKLSCIKPEGTFYMFVNIEKTGMGSLEFAEKLLDAEHVAVVPGETYGKGYTGYIRIAFTKDVSVLKAATDKIAHFVSNL